PASSFKNRNIVAKARKGRGIYLGAMAALAKQNGHASGDPPPFGNYESWGERLYTRLEQAGYNHFLETHTQEMKEALSIADDAFRLFVQAWYEKYGEERVSLGD